jgi:enterochelin esterase family protein
VPALPTFGVPLLVVFVLLGCMTSTAGIQRPTPGGSDAGSGQAGAGGTIGGTPGGGRTGGDGGSGGLAEPDAGSAVTDGSGGASDGGAGQAADGPTDGAPPFPVGDPGTMGDGDLTINPPYATQPDLTDRGSPKGKHFHFTMDSRNSMIFKGDDSTLSPQNQHAFTRGIDVYVPALYKDGTPAPVLVIQDGPGELGMVQNALDNLTISVDPARKLPPFVAVAVANGGGDFRGSERGLEYDTMSDRYARFIQLEVLPAVIADPNVKAAYPHLSFTDNPEGKATLGCSSGGAASFTMGWFRPDLFHRLITYSATLVSSQNLTAPEQAMYPDGAWDYHSALQLIANNPRKDLRIFLNANQMDNGYTMPDSSHFNFLLANQHTAAALKAKSYHYRFAYATQAGHCQGNVQSATLADTLLWAWRGYPAP